MTAIATKACKFHLNEAKTVEPDFQIHPQLQRRLTVSSTPGNVLYKTFLQQQGTFSPIFDP